MSSTVGYELNLRYRFGDAYEITYIVCPNCRAGVRKEWNFCPLCGAKLPRVGETLQAT